MALSVPEQFRIFNELRFGALYLGLNELRAAVMVVLSCTKRAAEKKIREALAAGIFVCRWTDQPPYGREPPQCDPRWLTVKIKWLRGLVRDEFAPAASDTIKWRGLLIYRGSARRWLEAGLPAPYPAPAGDQTTRSNGPQPAGEDQSVPHTNAGMVEAMWIANGGDPARGLGIKGAQSWIQKHFRVLMPIDTIRYQLRRLREKQRKLGPYWWKNDTAGSTKSSLRTNEKPK